MKNVFFRLIVLFLLFIFIPHTLQAAKAIVHIELRIGLGFGDNNPSIGFNISVFTDTEKKMHRFIQLTKAQMNSLTSTNILNKIRAKVKEVYFNREGVAITDTDIIIFGGPQ